jgi:Zn finger protein HypA/HybF involved in hydrogenase expression
MAGVLVCHNGVFSFEEIKIAEPILRIIGESGTATADYRAADVVGIVRGVIITGSTIVLEWAMSLGRTPEELAFARSYLEKRSGGPQITPAVCTCLRCGHTWTQRSDERPRICPKCKSPYWDKPRKARTEKT